MYTIRSLENDICTLCYNMGRRSEECKSRSDGGSSNGLESWYWFHDRLLCAVWRYTAVIAITVPGYYLMKESIPVIILSPLFLIFRFYLCNHLPGIFQLPYHSELLMQLDNTIRILKNKCSFFIISPTIPLWFNGIAVLLPILLWRFELCLSLWHH